MEESLKASPEYRLWQASYQVVSSLYSQFPADLGLGERYRQPSYDQSISIPAFNSWVESRWEKRLVGIQAMRALAKLAENGPNAEGDDA